MKFKIEPSYLQEIFEGTTSIMENPFTTIQWVVYTWISGPKWKIMDDMTHIHLSTCLKNLAHQFTNSFISFLEPLLIILRPSLYSLNHQIGSQSLSNIKHISLYKVKVKCLHIKRNLGFFLLTRATVSFQKTLNLTTNIYCNFITLL